MNFLISLIAVLALLLIAYVGAGTAKLEFLFGVLIPYAAIAAFVLGFVYRIMKWVKSPVPFRIPATAGQQKSLDFIRHQKYEAPQTGFQTVIRMALEVLFFRSLFRNTRAEMRDDKRVVYDSDKWLWAAGLAFHYSFLVIFIRHYRFFSEPVSSIILTLQSLDGFFQIGVPVVYATDIVILAAATFLLGRRLFNSQVRYISLPADYFPLLLILGIAVSGVWMRYFSKVDIVGVKELAMSWVTFSPTVPAGLGTIFYIHLFFVCTLLFYFPVSKLMHLGGVFLSPTRNMANNSRAKRHINPWNPEVKVHTYEEYEEEFHDVMKAAGLPLEKDE